jgi:oxygen-independent coproporphyrinogen-3 oxidase
VQQAGFSRFNVDLMFGLPGQTQAQALADLQTAIDSGASHVSWYQLTLEPNTEFFSFPPNLPDDDDIADTQLAGQRLLAATGLRQYEISAYAREGEASRHNLNYWRFGDYLAIGAGAHGKLSDPSASRVVRYRKTRQPDAYLARLEGAPASQRQSNIITTATDDDIFMAHEELVPESGLVFEFMLNALRLTEGVGETTFSDRTGLDSHALQPELAALQQQGLMCNEAGRLCATELGSRFLNDVLARFAG